MNRRHALTAAVATAAACAGAGWAWWQGRAKGTLSASEQSLWAQRFERPGGGELNLAALRGQPVLINFWATWCAPCIQELPALDAFYRQRRSQGWHVVGLAVDGPTPVREFLAKTPLEFPIGLAGLNGVDLSRSLGNERGGLPFSLLLDRRGAVVSRKLGALSPQELAEWATKIQ